MVGNFYDEKFDIHHIFPRKWCENKGISSDRYDTIVNKSAISARTNRKIGGRAPSDYCDSLDKHTSAAGIALNDILASHRITPRLLRSDDFDAFYIARRDALLQMIETAMGKTAQRDGQGKAEDYDEELEDDAVSD